MIAVALTFLLAAAPAGAEKMRLAYVLHRVKPVSGGILYQDMRRQATVFLPEAYELVGVHDPLSEFAMRRKDGEFELRFRFDSEEKLKASAKAAGAADPDEPSSDLAAAMVAAVAGTEAPPSSRAFGRFPSAAVRKEFGADWGFLLQQRVEVRNPELAKTFPYCQVFTLHRDGVGTYTVFQLYRTDSFEEYKRLSLGAFHVVKFLEPARRAE